MCILGNGAELSCDWQLGDADWLGLSQSEAGMRRAPGHDLDHPGGRTLLLAASRPCLCCAK